MLLSGSVDGLVCAIDTRAGVAEDDAVVAGAAVFAYTHTVDQLFMHYV